MATAKKFIVGMTGASGAIYGIRFIQTLLDAGHEVHLVITESGWRVLLEELHWNVTRREECLNQHFGNRPGDLKFYPIKDVGAAIASGSFRTDGMIVIPCSMGTLSGLAHGASGNLLERAADVVMKEGRPLLLVPRETPLNAIHLENMLKLSRLGVKILPAMPGFYHQPESIDDLVNFVVGKALDSIGVEQKLFRRWGE